MCIVGGHQVSAHPQHEGGPEGGRGVLRVLTHEARQAGLGSGVTAYARTRRGRMCCAVLWCDGLLTHEARQAGLGWAVV